MNGNALADVAQQRQRLLARSAALRATLSAQSAVLEPPLATADRVVLAARWLYLQRGWIAAGAVVVLVLRPRRAWRVVRFGWWAWRTARRVQPWLVAAGLVAPPASPAAR